MPWWGLIFFLTSMFFPHIAFAVDCRNVCVVFFYSFALYALLKVHRSNSMLSNTLHCLRSSLLAEQCTKQNAPPLPMKTQPYDGWWRPLWMPNSIRLHCAYNFFWHIGRIYAWLIVGLWGRLVRWRDGRIVWSEGRTQNRRMAFCAIGLLRRQQRTV